MIGVTATITKQGQIRDWARRMPTEFQRRAVKLVTAHALAIERTAKRLAPVDKNVLKASIHTDLRVSGSHISAAVGTDAKHGAYQEMGTGLYGYKHREYVIRPKNKKALAFVARAGTQLATGRALYRSKAGRLVTSRKRAARTVVAYVIHPGVRPQPFLGPAFDHQMPTFRADLQNLARLGFPR